MKVLDIRSQRSRVKRVKDIIKSAGNTIGSVHFVKREDGTLRKMSYRLHVQKPGYAASPTGKREQRRREMDSDNTQLTVLDVNKVIYRKGRICGRGAWRCIPIENVKRICVRGEIYKVRA